MKQPHQYEQESIVLELAQYQGSSRRVQLSALRGTVMNTQLGSRSINVLSDNVEQIGMNGKT